ncbi:MAG: hypothetical protein AAF943_06550 [Pseudomonadota bacterium]
MAFLFFALLKRHVAAVLFALGFALPAAAQFQQVLGMDANGFGRPVPAFAVTVPQGWQSKGGIVWGNQSMCNRYGYDFSWAAMSPDQRYGVAMLPAVRWTSSAQSGVQGCAVLQIGSARDAIQAILSRLLPQAQIIDFRPRPDFLQEMGFKPSHFDLGHGAWMKTHVDAGEALIRFQSDQGAPMRMTMAILLSAHETFMSGGGVMADMRFIQGETLPAWIAFAPDGQLNMEIAEQIRRSVQVNPAWQKEILKHHRVINKDNARTNREIGRIRQDTNNYISRLNQESFDNRMAAMDRSSQQFSDMMLERENWRDTDGTRLNAPMSGENMWRLDDGNYVSTDDHNFNPLGSTGQFGTQLQRWE